MTDYDIILSAPMPATLPERIRRWFTDKCPAPWLEVAPGQYVLYLCPEFRQLALDKPAREPRYRLAGNPHVVLMDEQRILMVSFRDEATDKALRAFVEWLSTEVDYDQYYGPKPIQLDDMTAPGLYE
ncbi:MAG: hypothetical protein MPN21_11715 [Thermoanaerobaculia bacterium]|nr:hypothetical protein [Thermoanaerobaculia bacterium]